MSRIKLSNRFIILFLVIAVLICGGCSNFKSTSTLDISDTEEKVISYLTERGYKTQTSNSGEKEFDIQGEKNSKTIHINFVILKSDYSQCTITLENKIDSYNQKYSSIDYGELFELSQILGVEDITDEMIKNACEDKRDCYDSSNDDYQLPSDKIMSKIYRVGFYENPIIQYELSAGYTETVNIFWNS
ncbi:MAG: hypothetical protein PUE08_00905 [Eubacteriales bacterium]|nr:hypothetical protein [Eubacteriales bacterium]